MHSGEDDGLGLGACGLAGETQRVADVIGDVLHLGPLIVVREHDRVPLAGQFADLRLHGRDLAGRFVERLDDRQGDGRGGGHAGSRLSAAGG